MLVKLFNWLDILEPQPATETVYFNERHQHTEANTINIFGLRVLDVGMRAEMDELMTPSRNIRL